MNRRRFVALAGCALAGTASCLGAQSPVTSDGIAATDFEVRDDDVMPTEADARVSFQPDARRVVVRGAMPAGNPCTVATLQLVAFQPAESSLTLVVGTKPTGDVLKRVIGCPDSGTVADFTATVTMESALPRTVTVTERSPGGRTQTTTVRRDQTDSTGGA